EVACSCPAVPISVPGVPVPGVPDVNNVRFPSGGKKFVWFRMLKHSALNCRLKVSERRRKRLFLIIEKSKSESPGPTTEFRPAVPSRLLGVGKAKHDVFT